MTDKIPERFVWAHRCLRINAKDRILEIGCGAGLFAELIASSLRSGKLVAIDKSRAMTAKAHQRLQTFENAGTVELITNELAKTRVPDLKFDKVVSFNVNIFWD
jgi:cyclopropane fatty-acyl-phospholipid synthase-like methyltransferase